MAAPFPFLPNFILFFIYFIPLCNSHSIFPQNLQTFYPFPFAPTIDNPPANLSPPPPTSNKPIAGVVLAILLISLFLFFFFIRKCVLAKRNQHHNHGDSSSPGAHALLDQNAFTRFNGNFNGFILQENGKDVIYWKKSLRRKSKRNLLDIIHNLKNEQDGESFMEEQRRKPESSQQTPLLCGKSSTSDLKMEVTRNRTSQAPPPLPAKNHLKAIGDGDPGKSSAEDDQVKLKPLHWDKVNTNVDYAMVWDKIDGGSFRFNGDLMEALFGYVATNKKSPPKSPTNSIDPNNGGRSQITIIDSRKSQNIAIILKSMMISRQELHDCLMQGQGLDSDILEKLVRIAPTQEEQSQILAYEGDPLKLADAESFIFHLLKAIPTAFRRLNAIFFRSSYSAEFQRLRDFSQTLELACQELQRKGLFMKLLEATLKAGNRLNSGTTRGNAEAFNLSSLLKLSDVKSTIGKTTLLQFLVAEVIKSEGKKRFSNPNSRNLISKNEKEIEYTNLGLSVVESLSSEFVNVKKASTIDYKTFISTSSVLSSHISEIQELVSNEGGEFMRKMMAFVKSAEEEIKAASREQTRVLQLVKKTTEYYETGDRNRENPLGLFIVVREFLSMVDKVCAEIARDVRGKGKTVSIEALKSSMTMRFPRLREHLICSRSVSDDDL